ncbi:D-2-hydroxyacid dehydrogenase [Kangiella sediminilitoris]|uniref:D-isomer specific 2-hydroxyacid dehydrogenase NAD-binding n=1 Tax=Kangiella sediminilitoris TaxID=1144748 RepID=A0A1B3B7T8_9GAMM|nr:D-2-hydroxyacid dehydrogenase [Kangiella sediminilitoris]AOE48846.1 D-isomer specific 2-hydroxyacid dehydrogenase NAD-binding [Kangiella sediminilitoris]
MHAVFLDADTLGNWKGQSGQPAVDLSPLANCFTEFDAYGLTDPEQVIERSQNADVIITNKVVLNREALEQLPNLKAIQLAATGMNNIDLDAAKELNIQCFNVADYSTFAVAQLTIQFMLNFATRACEHYQLTAKGAWQKSRMFTLTDFPIMELEGKTLVLVGYGNIGQKVEQLAQAFGMKVLVANIPGRPMRDNQVALGEALPEADFVSLHCPLTDVTQGLVDESFLQQMKSTAYIINTARGPVINEADLADGLKNKVIAGAGLDVLSVEPPSPDNPLLANDIPNLAITPHIAWASHEAKQRLIQGMADNMNKLNNS